jgi:hypothetical protein
MLYCKTCDRKKRVITIRQKVGRKYVWIKKCINCKESIGMEDYEAGTKENDKD